jgi:hypothetical protein
VAIELVLDIEQAVSSWYRKEFKWQEPRVSLRRFSQNPLGWAGVLQFNTIYLITANDIGTSRRHECVLKIYASERKAREEFETLAKLIPGFKRIGEGFSVPVPLALLPDIRGLLMSKVPGKRLDNIIWPSPIGKYKKGYSTYALDAIGRAGSWLATYQTIPSHEEPHNLRGQTLIEEVAANLHLCRQSGLDAHLVEPIASWLSQIENEVKGMTFTCVNTCVLQPNHILISDEETSVVDFGDAGCGWPTDDLATFLANCGIYKKTIYPMSASFEALCVNFLHAYSSRTKFDTNHWALLEISYVGELLNAILAPSRFAAAHLSWAKSTSPRTLIRWFSWKYWLSWIAYLAKREIAKKTANGDWQTLLKEYDASKWLVSVSDP